MDDKLAISLANYLEERISGKTLEAWLKANYQWPDREAKRVAFYKAFNKEIIPLLDATPINEDASNSYEKTIRIKECISRAIAETKELKISNQLVTFFISKWGGVDNNKPATTRGIVKTRIDMSGPLDRIYHFTNKKQQSVSFDRYKLTGRKLELNTGEEFNSGGVSSWSKYLTIKYPEWAHIYDARVAYSLNAIIYLYDLYDAKLWRMPPGRNGKTNMLDIETLIISRQIQNRNLGQYLNLITDSYKGVSNFRTKYLIDDKETYPRYLEILENAKSELDSRNDALCQNVSEIEAFIFADADGGIFNKVLNKSLRESEF